MVYIAFSHAFDDYHCLMIYSGNTIAIFHANTTHARLFFAVATASHIFDMRDATSACASRLDDLRASAGFPRRYAIR